MRAIGYKTPGPIDAENSLVDIDLPRPRPAGRDLLVEVRAVSVNPVDTKVRKRAGAEGDGWKVLGFDASGVVVETGPDAEAFKPGDAVFYAGSIDRPGTNSEFHLVDERIVGPKPKTLSDAQAAALPLTAITAWETLFDRLGVRRPVPGAANAVLIVGGAGGVSSVAIQLARQLTDLIVIATASRPETREWVESLGAHQVVDHSKPMAPQMAALGLGKPSFVFITNGTDGHQADIAELVAPQGRVGLIDDPQAFDATLFKGKAVSLNWESMFARPVHQTADMDEQGQLLREVSRLVDAGTLRTTAAERLSPINAQNLRKAHELIECGRARGKVVLEGF
ncbi:MAG: zinc-binding alcohol dehydrogenase family protein [Methylobacterium mesophilicum]|nr:zinc-binding alcohol dehydrogenase family protein [Methylobacterium mesophilicum]